MRLCARWAVLAVTTVAGLAVAQAEPQAEPLVRYDHRGSLGLLVGGGGEIRSGGGNQVVTDNGWRANVDAGGSVFIKGHWSGVLTGRVSFGGAMLGLAFAAVARNHFGDRFKTFFDLGLGLHVLPSFSVGPRGAVGIQYELSSVIGVFALIGVQFGVGNGLRFVGDLSVGFQFRSYLLE